MKTYTRKGYVITATAACKCIVRNASSKSSIWKNGVTKCKPVERHFSCWLSRFQETNGERILINWSNFCYRSFVSVPRMIFMTDWRENPYCSSTLKCIWKVNCFAVKTIRRTFSYVQFSEVLLDGCCGKKYLM